MSNRPSFRTSSNSFILKLTSTKNKKSKLKKTAFNNLES